jgi:hypothetical protein
MAGMLAIEHVTFKQWISTDSSTLHTIMKSGDEFTDILTEKLAILQPHSFTVVQQVIYMNELKYGLQLVVAIVLCDFADFPSYYKMIRDSIIIMPKQLLTPLRHVSMNHP